MAKVQLKLMVQDPWAAKSRGIEAVEGFRIEGDEIFLDGPVSRRLAVLDLDRRTGELHPGARFVPPPPGRKLAGYALPSSATTTAKRKDPADFFARDFNQVSVFTTVWKTLAMFEEADTLGRPVRWAFGAPQLLIVPRAGVKANAKYERDSHSLQFFHFPSRLPGHKGETVYTSLSHDIVAHETGHAILDGIAPDLYDALTPQSLAIHEAVADLVALVMAFRTNSLSKSVLDRTGGSIREATAFSWLAEELGRTRSGGRAKYLRSFLNQKTLDPEDDSRDEQGERNRVSHPDPHLLSQVLSGALYTLVVGIHEKLRQRFAARTGDSEFSQSGRALAVAAERFKRIVLRPLDYLPPGELSFADYGRALLASHQASHPGEPEEREWVTREFLRRHMAADPSQLEVETDFAHPAVADLDLETLAASDWAAYDFANRQRQLLGIPPGAPFRVRPRLDVTKLYYRRGGRKKKVRELIFKVSWDRTEANEVDPRLPPDRQITVGTTLAVDWQTRRVRALLTSDAAGAGDRDQRSDRSALLARLLDGGQLRLAGERDGGDVGIESTGEVMRLRRSVSLLHAAGAARGGREAPRRVVPKPPPGVDASAFFNLLEHRRRRRF